MQREGQLIVTSPSNDSALAAAHDRTCRRRLHAGVSQLSLRHSTRDEAPLIDASDGQFLTGAATHFLKSPTDSKWAAIPMKSQPQTRRPARNLPGRDFHCPGELLARTERYSDVRSCTQLAVNARAASTGTAPDRRSFPVERQGASRLVWKPRVGPSRNADHEAIRTWIRQPHRESRDSIAPHT